MMKIIAKLDGATPTEIFDISYDSKNLKHFKYENEEYDIYFNNDMKCIGILPASLASADNISGLKKAKGYKENTTQMFKNFNNSKNEQDKLNYAISYLLNHLSFVSCIKYTNHILSNFIQKDYDTIVKEHYSKWMEYKDKLSPNLNTDDLETARSNMKQALLSNKENIYVNLETLSKSMLGTTKYNQLKEYFDKNPNLFYDNNTNNSTDDGLPF